MAEFNEKFEGQIDKHLNDNAYTSRKISGVAGSTVGVGVFGGVGFLVFNSTIVFGIGGCKTFIPINMSYIGALGMILGGLIGSRIRRKIDLKKMSVYQLLSFKTTKILEWTKQNQSKID